MNKNMNKNLDKREKAAKISDAVGGLSEKTVLDTGKKIDVKGSAETEEQKSDGKRTAKIKSLGVTDVFDSGGAVFSPLLKKPEGVYINKAEHAARVVIDEEGCTAAAFNAVVGAMGGPPDYEDVDFVLDKPFIFAITDANGEILFMGCVYIV